MTTRRRLRITSPSNPRVRELLRAVRKGGSPRAVLLEGPHLVETASRTDRYRPEQLFLEPAWEGRPDVAPWLPGLEGAGCEVIHASEAVIRRLSSSPHPQGLVAVTRVRPAGLDELKTAPDAFLVAAEAVQDPGNVGAIVRIADAAGADAVVLLEGCCDPFSPKALRASAGSVFHLPVLRAGTAAFLERMRAAGVREGRDAWTQGSGWRNG